MLNKTPLMAQLLLQPLMIEPGKLSAIMAGLEERTGLSMARLPQPLPPTTMASNAKTMSDIAIIPIIGPLTKRAGAMNPNSTPLTSYQSVKSLVESAVADPAIAGIILDID